MSLEQDNVTVTKSDSVEVCAVLTPFRSTQVLTFPLREQVIVTFITKDEITGMFTFQQT